MAKLRLACEVTGVLVLVDLTLLRLLLVLLVGPAGTPKSALELVFTGVFAGLPVLEAERVVGVLVFKFCALFRGRSST